MEAVAGRPLDNRSTQWLKIPLKVSFLQHCELKNLLISAWISEEKYFKLRTRYNILNCPALF